jgi:hypothetical protein
VKLLGFKSKKMYRTKTKEELLEEFGENYWNFPNVKDMYFEEFGKKVNVRGVNYYGSVQGQLLPLNSKLVTNKPLSTICTVDVPVKTKVHIEIILDCHNTYNYNKNKIKILVGQYSISELLNKHVLEWKDDEYNQECIIIDEVKIAKIEIK